MTLNIRDNPVLLRSLLMQEPQKKDLEKISVKPERLFADRLDQALGGDATAGQAERTKAQNLAEVLSLQMLQSTLVLAGEGSSESAPAVHLFGQQQAALKALVEAYTAEKSSPSTALGASEKIVSPEQPVAVASPTTSLSVTGNGKKWLDPIIAKASQRYGVEAGLIKAVIKAESNFNPTAVSSAGARGLMQLMPGTARSLGVTDSFDPEQNVMAGTRFLRDLLNRYNGDLDSALAAYNWGPGNVDRKPDRMPRETRDYLTRVKQLYSSYIA